MATARARSRTPDGIAPIFDFGELEAVEGAVLPSSGEPPAGDEEKPVREDQGPARAEEPVKALARAAEEPDREEPVGAKVEPARAEELAEAEEELARAAEEPDREETVGATVEPARAEELVKAEELAGIAAEPDGEEPARAKVEPARGEEELVKAAEEPARAEEEPEKGQAAGAEKPVKAEEEPVRADEEPAGAEKRVKAVEEAGGEEEEAANVEEEPMRAEKEPALAEVQPTRAEKELAMAEKERAREEDPQALEKEPAAEDLLAALAEDLPARAEEVPASAEEEPVAVEEEVPLPVKSTPAELPQLATWDEHAWHKDEQHDWHEEHGWHDRHGWHEDNHSYEDSGEWYVVSIATYVNIFPFPDDRSGPILGRLGRKETALLFEWDDSATWRKCKVNGKDGCWPTYGWVKVLTWKYGPLLVPLSESQQLSRLCQGDASGVLRSVLDDMCEENVQKHVPTMLEEKRQSRQDALRTATRVQTPGSRSPLNASDGRLVLGPTPRPPGRAQHFRRALVMGAHHTCTTALTRELEAQFVVKVENNYDTVLPEARPPNHKHLVLKAPPEPQDSLIICLIKEPCFWLQSLTRHGATYAIHALQELPKGGYADLQRHVGVMDERSPEELLDAILGPVEFMGDVYPHVGALCVWEASVRSYFDPKAYPLWRTAVVRCEDFLFSFEAVMSALSKLGLERRPNPPPPNGRKAKGGVIHYRARDREEALQWYGEPDNRWVGLESRHVDAVFRSLGDLILGPLCYGQHAVGSWSSCPASLFIAGTWAKFQPQPMAWDGLHFIFSARIGKDGEESFQLLLEGRWSNVYYPSVANGCPQVEHQIMGPDEKGHGKNWTIGRHHLDLVQPGSMCYVNVDVDPCGVPIRVEWFPAILRT